ncbi:MAG TPA: PKD domain-containing protein [Ferruginibacter sp.]|nr:PKD domain-containing protein [Ferruginibacter sp.]
MKKFLLLLILSIVFVQDICATHTKGGWMYYEYLGPGIIDPAKLRYRVGLNFYVECNTAVPEQPWFFTFYSGSAPHNFIQDVAVFPGAPVQIQNCNMPFCYPCITNIPTICYEIRTYETIVELTPNNDGYIISKQRCCRINFISNVFPPSDAIGATYTIKIPGLSDGPTAQQNTSPKFIFNDTAIVCSNSEFSLNFTATDIDNDSLVYRFCDAYNGGDGTNSSPNTAAPPPYAAAPYLFPYTGSQPLGSAVTIDPATGVISGIAPPTGEYVINVCVTEYRNGIAIAESRKELHLKITPCTPVIANPNPDYTTCDGFTINFYHASSGANDVFWDFGDLTTLADTSLLDNPPYTYPDTGIYIVRFIINRGLPCTDTAYRTMKVYPGFLPGFLNSAPLCIGLPVQFTDTTYSRYGPVDSWRWDFGDPSTLADTSHLQNPAYTYSIPGTYNVQLIVTNDKGCLKIYNKDVIINGLPPLTLFPGDTTYCGLDSLQLTATGTGSFNWAPATNITGANTATPLVYPPIPTKYVVTLTDANGCKSRDSLTVTPKLDLTNAIIAAPPTICEEDTLVLSGSSNHLTNVSWQWTPMATVEFPGRQVTRAYPVVNTTYTLTTTWGTHCVATANQNIIVRPLAIPNAGADAFVCNVVPTSTQLSASGGASYQWTPVTGLSNPNIPNPVASPTAPTYYIVAVGVAGCPKLRTDTVFVDFSTAPLISTLNDTLICNIDTLQLTTSGTGNFSWTPNYMISNTNIASPVVSPDVPTWYYVSLTNSVGCRSRDSVFVDVKNVVSLNAGADTTTCQADGFFLNVTSDALHYKWTPSTYLDYDTLKRPYVKPLATITYTLVGNIGKCQSQGEVTITVVPYPLANAGPDTSICLGFSTQLKATGGSSYAWSPESFLNSSLIANPVCSLPTGNIRYIVTIRDTLGCPKPVKDTIWVRVYQRIKADAGPRDTSIVEGEPLFLHATGADSYVWSPSTWLNNPAIPNPVSLPQKNIQYILTATSLAGCVGTDTIDIKLYKLDPDIYVPNAFTPNGDNINDVLRPILIGMKDLNFFRVYNRWGVLMFSTTEKGKGWDGRYGGKAQDPANFVWMAEGVTYKGQLRRKKGNAVLIR